MNSVGYLEPNFRVAGSFRVECCDPEGVSLWEDTLANAATLEGLTALLADFFNAGTQKTAWYLGVIDGDDFEEVDLDDTLAAHPGWNEFTGYVSATRPAWSPLTVESAVVTNENRISLVINVTTARVRGFFIASNNTKGGTTGTLWATALFSRGRELVNGNSLRLTYTVRASGGHA